MRRWLKRIATYFLVPLTRWYLRKSRSYSYHGSRINVSPGVFHPGLFYSTKFLLEFLQTQNLNSTTLLELGCGSGLISIIAAKAGANVTGCDLSVAAINNARENFKANNVNVECLHSDLFDSLPNRLFDWIIINPPYYARPILNEEQLAWHCGSKFQYFEKLFSALRDHITENTQVIMVLTLGCDLKRIISIAENNHFVFELIKEKSVLFDEKDYLFRIKYVKSIG